MMKVKKRKKNKAHEPLFVLEAKASTLRTTSLVHAAFRGKLQYSL